MPIPARATRRGLLALAAPAPFAAPARAAESRFFQTSDGVRLHYLEAGPRAANAPPLVIVPGWCMPAWLFEPQLRGLSSRFRVIVLDPRGQGRSDIPDHGYDHVRRGADIGDLLDALRLPRAVVLGWSLGVLDTLGYVATRGDARVAGLILVDNSVGEDPPPTAPGPRPPRPQLSREEWMRRFVRGMFRHPPSQATLDRLTSEALRMPSAASQALLSYPVPRSYWRDAVYSTSRPVLYAVRPRFAGQAANLAARHPNAETVVFAEAGHAMFADEPDRFNAMVTDFVRRKVGT